MSDSPKIEFIQNLFPEYDILQIIASGGMGVVYLAEHKLLKRKTSIKILNQESAENEIIVGKFVREADSMALLSHSNIVLLYDFGIREGCYFIIMEYIDGKSLHYSAYQKAIDPEITLNLMIGVARGISAVHAADIIHRDIKPSNIVLTQKKQPKVCDFGLAHKVGHLEKLTYTTEGYSAPEAYNALDKIGKPTDIYSLGVVFYELLTGHKPNTSQYKPVSQFIAISTTVDGIITRCLQANPEHRYSDASELLEKLLDLRYTGINVSNEPPIEQIAPVPPRSLITSSLTTL